MPDKETSPRVERRRPAATGREWKERAGPVFWAGLVVGMALATGGFISLSQNLAGNTTGQLILCSGLGIVFGAFGSTATLKYKGAVIAGVAAVAISLLLVVDHLIKDNYLELEIVGDVNGADISIEGDENYLGAPRNRKHKFIIIASQIRTPHLSVEITPPEEVEGEGPRDYVFECVNKNQVEPFLGAGEIVQWRFDQEKEQLLDSNQKLIADVGPCLARADAGDYIERPSRSWLADLKSGLFSVAFAQSRADTTGLIRSLGAKSSYVRREARKSLANQGLDAARPLLDEVATGSYRTRLGALVALTEMLRENKDRREELLAIVTREDLTHLVGASGHKDRTVRVYASEFLYDLGDVEVVPIVFNRFERASGDGKYNLLVVVEGTYPYLDEAARAGVNRKLDSLRGAVGPKTQELISRIVVENSATERRFWVIVGSYTDRSEAKNHADRINAENGALNAFVGKRQPNNPYYPVIMGEYVPQSEAEALVKAASKLNSVRTFGSAPYLSAYADRR